MVLRLYAERLVAVWRPRTERGQTLVEYGLLLALIALVVIAAVTVLGAVTSGFFNDFSQSVEDVT